MTTAFVNRQSPAYLRLVEERALARDLGPDYADYKWAQETLTRLEKRPCDWPLSDKDFRDLEKIRAVFDRIEARIYAKANFNPAQPRVPAGNPDGGQWTGTGSGTGDGSSPPLPPRKPQKPKHPHADSPYYDPVTGTYDPPIRPVGNPLSDALILFPAARAAGKLATTTAQEAVAVVKVLRARAAGRVAAEESSAKVRSAANAIEDFLGGKPNPKDVIINPKGDIVIMRGNRKFRMDVKNPGYKRDSGGKMVDEEPHFHLQKFENGEWVDAADKHRYYFEKGTPKK